MGTQIGFGKITTWEKKAKRNITMAKEIEKLNHKTKKKSKKGVDSK